MATYDLRSLTIFGTVFSHELTELICEAILIAKGVPLQTTPEARRLHEVYDRKLREKLPAGTAIPSNGLAKAVLMCEAYGPLSFGGFESTREETRWMFWT